MDSRAAAAELLRIITAYDNREYDDANVIVFADGIASRPQFHRDDWHEAIRRHYHQPDAKRITVGALIAGAAAAHRWRTEVDRVELASGPRASKPANFDQMVFMARQITREFKAHGVITTKEDVDRELARRLREAQNAA